MIRKILNIKKLDNFVTHERIAEQTAKSMGSGQERRAPNRAINVWLVEDRHTFRNTIARVLNQVGDLECPQHFSNSEDALTALAEGVLPDVVLVDVELPGMDGIEAVRRMKAISPSTRIIMLTVFDDHDKILKAICAGASGYLLKTSPVEKIVESIRDVHARGAP